jgi:hypothetical protein
VARKAPLQAHPRLFGQFLPDVGRLRMLVPICTENWLRFGVRLDDEAPEVSFERAVAG